MTTNNSQVVITVYGRGSTSESAKANLRATLLNDYPESKYIRVGDIATAIKTSEFGNKYWLVMQSVTVREDSK